MDHGIDLDTLLDMIAQQSKQLAILSAQYVALQKHSVKQAEELVKLKAREAREAEKASVVASDVPVSDGL